MFQIKRLTQKTSVMIEENISGNERERSSVVCYDNVTAIVLAGGAATRMGGLDKGLAELNGRPFVEHVLERIKPQCAQIVISANRNRSRYEKYGFAVVSDLLEGYQGPLAGIAAALSIVETPFAVVAACDSPFIPLDYVKRLSEAFVKENVLAAAVSAQGRRQPIFMMLRRTCLGQLEKYLRTGGRKVGAWLESLSVRWVEFDRLDDFDNLNSFDDVRRARCRD